MTKKTSMWAENMLPTLASFYNQSLTIKEDSSSNEFMKHFDKLVEDTAKYQQPLKIILLEGADHDGFLEYMIPWYEKNVPVFLKDNLVDGKQQKSMKTITHQDIFIRTKVVPRELLK